MEQLIDVAIIGGGPAGLNAALVLGRARRSVIVIDEERPRNRVTRESHGFLTRDGMNPGEFRKLAKEQIGAYPSVRFAEDTAVAVSGRDGDFWIGTKTGAMYRSRKLLFAVGKKDLPIEINGLAEVYGKSAFVCPYCDGWEMRDQPLVLIARGDGAMHSAMLLSGWTNDTVLCTNGPDGLTPGQRAELDRHRIPVFEASIRAIESTYGIVECVILQDGITIACKGIFFTPRLAPGSDLPQTLGCRLTPSGTVAVDAYGKTNVPGVYSAGDAATELYQVVTAASTGALAAIGINGELLEEAWYGQE
ncbi:NAD(P)/FAD-dependent oxidoreductase [Paenibacillus thailandensis]|uniref:NAD(P)/FAD-dependent oxidoreductase n=1 Tax=Paenibacillus thailandensis TaxID=393250 RepID=A0ABW5R3G4_9BACL